MSKSDLSFDLQLSDFVKGFKTIQVCILFIIVIYIFFRYNKKRFIVLLNFFFFFTKLIFRCLTSEDCGKICVWLRFLLANKLGIQQHGCALLGEIFITDICRKCMLFCYYCTLVIVLVVDLQCCMNQYKTGGNSIIAYVFFL